MGFDGNGSARGAIQYAFDCIGPRIGIGTVDARLTEIGHAANDPPPCRSMLIGKRDSGHGPG
ncbi:hypothetical protein WL34_09595 [Burkholderia cepacia]|nr:hypothetical protein WL34_09595 [Burkholderia cepacia]